ncbi:MAG: ABC transporter permease [Clostridia bacterium]|nr:ABC transporter permease [Clostridia bacterium]
MKIQSVKYLTREGFRNVWVNRLMSIASIGVLVACMVLIGFAILITENVNVYMNNLEQQNVVMVYFNDKNSVIYQDASQLSTTSDTSSDSSSSKSSSTSSKDDKSEVPAIPDDAYLIHNEEEAKAVCAEIEKLDNVKKPVEFISSEQALENAKGTALQDMAGAFEILDEEGGNPMSHGARVTLISMEKFDQTVESIKKVTGVHSVVSHGDLAKTIADIKSGISMICFWIIGILGVIALVIVSNTIRVTMYNRKLEISIMKAVGATDAFVRLPFVIEGVVLGLFSAILSEAILYFCYRVAAEAMGTSFTLSVPFSEKALLLFGIFAAIGIVAGALGSAFMISKYLKKEGSEFKAL